MSVFKALLRAGVVLLVLINLSACTAMAITGAVVGTATAVVVEVVEVPFEVAGGVHGALTDDDEDENDEEDDG